MNEIKLPPKKIRDRFIEDMKYTYQDTTGDRLWQIFLPKKGDEPREFIFLNGKANNIINYVALLPSFWNDCADPNIDIYINRGNINLMEPLEVNKEDVVRRQQLIKRVEQIDKEKEELTKELNETILRINNV